MLATFFMHRKLSKIAAAGILGMALGVMAASGSWAAETGILHLNCTNDAGGASLRVAVDLEHKLVESRTATITDKWISWPDAKQGFFDLERATGRLQFRNASSTGGYFLHYTCRSE